MLRVINADDPAYVTDNCFGAISQRARGRTLGRGERVIIDDMIYKVVKKDEYGNAVCSEIGQAPAYGKSDS